MTLLLLDEAFGVLETELVHRAAAEQAAWDEAQRLTAELQSAAQKAS